MLQDLRFRIVGADASGPAFRSVQQSTKATEAAVTAMNGSLVSANRSWLALGQGAGDATRLSTQQMANLQYQLNDIGVMLASGQSPFLLMMQQGSQIVQMFGPGTGVLAALKAVGSGLVTFLTNPLNLGLLALAGASAAVGALWSAVREGGESAESVLERHVELVRRLNDAYGDATRGVRDYARESATIVQFQFEQHIAGLRVQLRDAVEGFIRDITFTDQFGQTQMIAGLDSFSEAVARFAASAEDGEPDVRAFRETIVAMARARPELAGLATELLNTSDAIDTLSRAIEGSRTGTPDPSYAGYVNDAFLIFERERAMDRLRSELGRGRSRGRSGKSEEERQAEAIAAVIDQLRFEAEQLGRTAQEQELYNALKRAGVDRASEMGQAIEQEVLALQAARAEMEANERAQEALLEAQQFFADTTYRAFSDLIRGGATLEQVMMRVADAIAEAALQAVLLGQGPLAGLLGGGGGGLLGGLLSLFGGGRGMPISLTPGGGFGLPVPVGHGGGVVGSGLTGRRLVDPMIFAGAPRMHGGGIAGLRHDEVPAILQRGETVLPKGVSAAAQPLNVIVNTPPGTEVEDVRRHGDGSVEIDLVRAMDDAQAERVGQRGASARAMERSYGLSPVAGVPRRRR